MYGTIMQIIKSKLYIIVRSSDPYTEQQNKCEGHIRELKFLSKLQMIQTNSLSPIWYS